MVRQSASSLPLCAHPERSCSVRCETNQESPFSGRRLAGRPKIARRPPCENLSLDVVLPLEGPTRCSLTAWIRMVYDPHPRSTSKAQRRLLCTRVGDRIDCCTRAGKSPGVHDRNHVRLVRRLRTVIVTEKYINRGRRRGQGSLRIVSIMSISHTSHVQDSQKAHRERPIETIFQYLHPDSRLSRAITDPSHLHAHRHRHRTPPSTHQHRLRLYHRHPRPR